MSDEPGSLVLEHLRHIRADIAGLREDVREIKHRQNDTSRILASMRREQAGDAETVAHVEARLNLAGERLN